MPTQLNTKISQIHSEKKNQLFISAIVVEAMREAVVKSSIWLRWKVDCAKTVLDSATAT
jgi:hypothetical protein